MALQAKRYQVFISSTFEDLKEERRAVQDVIISTGDFPVQMESFPAADEDQFEFIKSLIDHCDYYVLIIAGRYGTVAEDGMSYTEKEYRYAVSKGVPVLVMIHNNRGSIAADKSEKTEESKEYLEHFIVPHRGSVKPTPLGGMGRWSVCGVDWWYGIAEAWQPHCLGLQVSHRLGYEISLPGAWRRCWRAVP